MKRRAVSVLLALLLVAGLGGGARGEHGPVEGYCDGDTPVFTHPLPPEALERYCLDGVLYVHFPPPSFSGSIEPLSKPPDFYSWVFVYINGRRAVNPYEDVDPYIARSTGRTLVPIRFVTEALGGKVEWFEDEWKVRLTWKDKYMEMVIGESLAVANDREVLLDQPPIIVADRTVVPARAVAEAFGARVEYFPRQERVSIELEGAQCPYHICY